MALIASPTSEGRPGQRTGGRPRDEGRRDAILVAAGDLMAEGGLAAATMERIAARAGVSKQTIYNWWPSHGAVALEGLMRRSDPIGRHPEDVAASDALRLLAVDLVRLFASPAGALLRGLIAEAQSEPEIAQALRDQWLAPRRAPVIAIVESGVASGEFRSGVDVDVVMDLVFGPIYYRLLGGHRPLSEATAVMSIDLLLTGVAVRQEPSSDIGGKPA